MATQSSGLSLFRALIAPLRQADEQSGQDMLLRYLKGPQIVHDRTESDIQTLLDQVDPNLVRSDLLKFLKDIVGFTVELRGITDRLDEASLRRLITLSVPLWNERHTEPGLINAIRLLTGRTSIVSNWFFFRFLLNENLIGEDQLGVDSWIIGGDVSRFDEFWTNIRIMDDGTLDELLLIDVAKLERPLDERLELFLMDFLDRLDTDISQWDLTEGTVLPTIVSGAMQIPAGTEMERISPIFAGVPFTQISDYVLITKFNLGTGASFRVTWYRQGASSFIRLTIKSTIPDRLKLESESSPNPIVTNAVSDALSVGLVDGADFKLRIETLNTTLSGRRVRIYIDNNLLIETTVITSEGNNPEGGPWRFKAITAAVTVDNPESWRNNPARFATIETSTLTERGGKVTKSSNFVL